MTEIVVNVLECVMIFCFGLSWPFSIIKAYKSKTAKGTSVFFTLFIAIGYVAGIIGKFVKNSWSSPITILATVFYFINLIMVSTGIFLYFRNKKLDKLREQDKN